MASKCGCAGNSCSCKFVAGRGVRLRGSGAQNNPIVIDAYPMSLAVQDSTTIDLTLTGDGTQGNPWSIKADLIGSSVATKWQMWSGTQAAYDALPTKDVNTLYAITG